MKYRRMTNKQILDIVQKCEEGARIDYRDRKGALDEWEPILGRDPVWDFSSLIYKVYREPLTLWVNMPQDKRFAATGFATKDAALDAAKHTERVYTHVAVPMREVVEDEAWPLEVDTSGEMT